MTAPDLRPHPAKYSPEILAAIVDVLETYPLPHELGNLVLDPMAGTGRIHQLAELGYCTRGVELEPEWAAYHPHTTVGDATHLDYSWTKTFAYVITSPPYFNRMADSYDGRDGSRRHTYRIDLGRPLTDGSGAGLQWGDEARAFSLAFIREIRRVLKDGGLFLLNVKDHERKGVAQLVPQWFEETCQRPADMAFQLLEWREIGTRHMRDGANANARYAERLYVFRKP